jgi:hypothetical protein
VAGLALPALVAVCPQALAHDRVKAMEEKLRQMQQGMDALQQELDRMRSAEVQQDQAVQGLESQNATQHQEMTDRVTAVEKAPGKRTMKNLVFFRGGYVDYADDEARGFESFTDTHDVVGLGNNNSADGGWYVGASIEHSLTDDLWGLWPTTEALGEISLEFKRFGSERIVQVVPTAECVLAIDAIGDATGDVGDNGLLEADGGCLTTGDGVTTMFTVSAAPKIKFLQGHPWKIRPWLIPAGLDFHVLSPPSDSATYLDVGVQFAGGVEYEILPGIKFGIDARYHLTANETNTDSNFVEVFNRELDETALGALNVPGNTDHDNAFWTAGAYLGFGF